MTLYVVRDDEAPAHTDRPVYPLVSPNAPKLSAYVEKIAQIEGSRWLSNYGPVNSQLEKAIVEQVFGGVGGCLTVCNATTGLMIALKLAADRCQARQRYVVMPSFTFAAAAHAVLWAGLKPLLIDIDPITWAADPAVEERVIRKYRDQIAAIMPYATFGSCIDLEHYDRLAEMFDLPVVVDAAASIGSMDAVGRAFGTGSRHTVVFSMHATKPFCVGECGLVYSADVEKIETLRRMGNFGFDGQRSAVMAGLNSKISEITALSALIKLSDYRAQSIHRWELAKVYSKELPGWTCQKTSGSVVAYQFMPLLLPNALEGARSKLSALLTRAGICTGEYFSPHIHQQPYFATRCKAERLPNTDAVAARIISLPMSDFLGIDEVLNICGRVRDVEAKLMSDTTAFLAGGVA